MNAYGTLFAGSCCAGEAVGAGALSAVAGAVSTCSNDHVVRDSIMQIAF